MVRRLHTENKLGFTWRCSGIIFMVLFLFQLPVNAQGPYCPGENCTANDIQDPVYFLGDAQGNPITFITCVPGNPVNNVYLWLTFQVTATNRYDVNVVGDVLVEGQYDHTFDICLGDFNSGVYTEMLEQIIWNCGFEMKVNHTLFSWENNDDGNNPNSCHICPTVPSKCHRFGVLTIKAPIVADFSLTSSCSTASQYEVYTFTDETTGGTLPYSNYSWNFGPGSTPTPSVTSGPNATGPFVVTYNSTGIRTITLTVTDANGVISIRSYDINVQAVPVITVNASDQEICDGGTVTLTAAVPGGTGLVYQWQQLLGGTWNNIGSNQSTYATPILSIGTYQYRVMVTSNGFCTVTSSTISINVVGDPTVTISALFNTICEGGSANLTANVTGGTGLNHYQWQQLLSGTWTNVGSDQSTYTSNALTLGTYSYRVNVTQDAGCNAVSTSTVITVVTDPTVSVTSGDGSMCEGGMAVLTANVVGGAGTTNYQWQQLTGGNWSNVGTSQSVYTTPALSIGSYSYRVLISQNTGCSATSATFNVNVVADPTITATATESTICNGGNGFITATVSGGTGTSNFQWQFFTGGIWANVGNNQNTYMTPELSTGTYQYRVLLSQNTGCLASSATVTITVVNDPIVSVTSNDAAICDGGSALLTANVTGGAGSSNYQWQQLINSSWINVGTNQGTYTSPALSIGSYTYRVLVTQNSGCSSNSASFVVSVFGDPTVTVNALQSTICDGGSGMLTATVVGGAGNSNYQWQFLNSGTWSNVGTNQNTYTTPGLSLGSYQYRVIVTQNAGCLTTSASTTITVVSDPTVTVTSNDGNICTGGSALLTANITGGAGSPAYQWQFLSGGNWVNVGTNQNTYLTPVLTIGSYLYRVNITQNSGCSASSSNFTVSVVGDPTVSVTAFESTICNGGTGMLTATVTGGAGTSNYQWQFLSGGTWTNVGGNQNTYTTPVLSIGAFQYRVIVTQNSGCETTSANTTITVVSDPNVTVTSNDGSICDGGTALLTANVTGGAGTTFYQWQSLSSGTWVNVGSNLNTYTTPALTIGSYQYRVLITQNSGCSATSASFSVSVVGDPTVTITAAENTICSGGSAFLTASVIGGTGTTIYQWQLLSGGNWTNVGPNQNTYTTPALSIGTYQYRVMVTQNSGCLAFSASTTITVLAGPTVTISSNDATMCTGGSALLTAVITGGSGSSDYQWQFLNGGTWTNVGSNQNTYTTPVLTIGTYQYRVQVDQNSGCLATSASFTVSVVGDPTVTVSALQSTICDGGNGMLTANVTGGAGTSNYQWQFFTGTWTNVGTNQNTYTTPALTIGSFEYRVIVTQNAGCLTTSAGLTITVVTDPTVSVSSNDGNICTGGSALLTANVAGGAGNISYQWQNFTGGSWSNVGTNQNTYLTPALTIGTYQYRVLITQNSGCAATSSTFIVNVVNDPTVTVSAAQSTICDGGTGMLTATVAGGAGTSNYQWQFLSSGTWTNVGANQNTYTTPVLSVGSYQYRVIVNQNAGCQVTSANATITVVTDPTVSVSSNDGNICDGGTALLTANVSGGAGSTNYQWQSFTGSVWLNVGTNQNSYTTPVLSIGSYTYRVLITQNSGCSAASANFTVTVVTDPTVVVSAAQSTICTGGNGMLTATVTGGAGNSNYQWQFFTGGAWTNVGTNQNTYTTPVLTIGTYQYRAIVTQNSGCLTASASTTITVVADPTVTITSGDANICNGETALLQANVTGGAGSTNYQWQLLSSGNWTNVGSNQNTYTTPQLSVGSYQYRVLITQNSGCSSQSATFVVTVSTNPSVSLGPDVTICSGVSIPITATVTGGTGPFTYLWNTGQTTQTINVSPGSTTTYTVTVTDVFGCSNTSIADIVVNVNQSPNVDAGPNLTICLTDIVTITAVVSSGTAPFTYVWSTGATTPAITVNPQDDITYTVTVTDANGCTDVDQVAVTVNLCIGLIAGYVLDENDNPMPNVTLHLYADSNNDGNPDGPILMTEVTDGETGAYFFEDIGPGNYVVVEIQPINYDDVNDYDYTTGAFDPDGNDSGQGPDNNIPVTLAPFEGDLDNNFYEDANVGFIRGFLKTNLNQPIANVTLQLYGDANGDGNPDGPILITTITDALGFYEFLNIEHANFVVVEIQPANHSNISDYDQTTGAFDPDGNDIAQGPDNNIPVTLAPGEIDADNNFTEDAASGLICGNVMDDLGNPLANITLQLFADANMDGNPDAGSPLYITTTDGETGNYCFEDIEQGTYVIVEIQPANYTSVSDFDETPDPDGNDSAQGPDNNIPVVLTPAESDQNNDFVEHPLTGQITGKVREDTGVPMPGIVIKLYYDVNGDNIPDTGTPLGTTTTNASGVYTFTGVIIGGYVVTEMHPSGYLSISDIDGSVNANDLDGNDGPITNEKIPINITPGETDADNDFVEYAYPGLICGTVTDDLGNPLPNIILQLFPDLNNDGLPDAGAPVMTVTTDGETGAYCFEDVVYGVYVIVEIQPMNYDNVSDYDHTPDPDGNDSAQGADNNIPVVLTPGESDLNNDFIEHPFLGNITGQVREDVGLPIPGIQIKLFSDTDQNNIPDNGTPLAITTSDATGYYAFNGIIIGGYVVVETHPTGFQSISDKDGTVNASDPDGNDGSVPNEKIPIVITAGETDADNDFVEYAYPGIICGNVSDDLGNPMPNVVLQLFADANGDGIPDPGTPLYTTTTDGETGNYCFEDISHGIYVIVEIQPTNYDNVSDYDHTADPDGDDSGQGADNNIPVILNPAESDLNNDFIEHPYLANITGKVLEDPNIPIPGVQVKFFSDINQDNIPDNGTPIGTTTTNALGEYSFNGILIGSYVVVETHPTGYQSISDIDGSVNASDPDGNDGPVPNEKIPVVLAAGETDATNNFIEYAYLGLICGTVKDDLNNPLPNITLKLYLDANQDGVADAGSPVMTTTTDGETGGYCFEDVYHGTYVVVEVQPVNYSSVSDYDHTPDPDGDDSGQGPDDNIPVVLNPGESDLTNDFIEHPFLGNITGQVREDTGVPVQNVLVKLFSDINMDNIPDNGTPIGTATTNAMGLYAFNGIIIGGYVVVETHPAGYLSISDIDGSVNASDPDGNDGAVTNEKIPIVIAAGETDANNDFVEFAYPGLICGTVTDDLGNPLPNIVLQLFPDINNDGLPDAGAPLMTTTTDGETGGYCFEDVLYGIYVIVEIQPANYDNVSDYDHSPDPDGDDSGQGADNNIPVVLAPGESDQNNDFIEHPQVGNILGQVREDTNVPMVGVTIKMYSDVNQDNIPDNGTPLATTTTNATGNYSFNGIIIGGYVVVETQPNGFQSISDKDGSVNATDLDGNDGPVPNEKIPVVITPGETDADNDFVELAYPGLICGSVKDDLNNPLANVTLQLFADANNDGNADPGSPLMTTTTDGETGIYCFEDVLYGIYVVVEIQPVNYNSLSDYDHSTGPTDPDGNDSGQGADNNIPVNLAPGEADLGNDFIEDPNPGIILGKVAEDTGVPVAGVTIKLHLDINGDGNADGAPIGTTLTNVLGIYQFTGVEMGNYVVKEMQPANYFSLSDYDHTTGSFDPDGNDSGQGADEDIPVFIAPGETDATNDFEELAYPSLICGKVTDEVLNPLPNVTLHLYGDADDDGVADGPILYTTTTDGETGGFCFEDVVYDHYVVVEVLQNQYEFYTDYDHTTGSFDPDGNDSAQGADGDIPVITVPGEADLDNIFVNISCPGLPAVNGSDEYFVCDGHSATISAVLQPIPGVTYTWTFGELSSPSTATGPGPHTVFYGWSQNNQNQGAQVILTLTKPGCPTQTGEVARVYVSPIPDPTINADTFELCAMLTRDFVPQAPEIPGGIYSWNFGSGASPSTAVGYGPHEVTYSTVGEKFVKLVVNPNYPELASCPDSSIISFEVIVCPGNIGGVVKDNEGVMLQGFPVQLWHDSNIDGIPDGNNPIESTVTNTLGQFAFTQLIPDNYVLKQIPLSGFTTIWDGDETPDGDIAPNLDILDNLVPVTLIPGSDDIGNSFIKSNNKGSISGCVFDDADMDQVLDANEGAEDVKVYLYSDLNLDGLPDPGGLLDSALTNSVGIYVFMTLDDGFYVVKESQPAYYGNVSDADISPDGDPIGNSNSTDDNIPATIDPAEADGGNYFFESLNCSTTVVNTNNDGFGSLRGALACVLPGDTIYFSSTIAGDTIVTTGQVLTFSKSVTLYNAQNPWVVIKSQIPGHMVMLPGNQITLHNLVVVSGPSGSAAAIQNQALLKLESVYVRAHPLLNLNSNQLIKNLGGTVIISGQTKLFGN